MNRTLQLLGLLLIGLLSFQAEAVRASQACYEVGDCTYCHVSDDCETYTCDYAVGIICDDE